jgi:ABC-type phosphate transport system substrate-binding protein
LLEDVYRQKFGTDPNSNDLYAIVYYNNKRVLEGYTIYQAINPASLEIKKGWTIFIPSQEWIREYKKFPATVPQPVQTGTKLEFRISGSSILSPLSAQISKCSPETTKIELKQINSSTTVSGLQDLCQGNADVFGANREVDSKMLVDNSCDDVELEKFVVARYAMVVFINKNNPSAGDIRNHPLTTAELAELLTAATSWTEIRSFWENHETIVRQFPLLESGDFEVVKDGIFPDWEMSEINGLNTFDDDRLLMDAVVNDKNAIGIVDYDSYQKYENKDQLMAIPVNGAYAGPEILDNDTSKYPLLTNLYLYVGKNTYETNASLRSLINYYLSHELDYLEELGYFYPSRKGYMSNRDTIP